MIISFKHKYIFFAVPKTATHAMRIALRPQLHKMDWEQCTLFEKKYFPPKEFHKLNHGHISYNQLSGYLLPELLENYFKFAFVRNPYDRFVSACHFIYRKSDAMVNYPIETMKETINNKEKISQAIFQPQYTFLINENGDIKMNYIGRFENLTLDYEKVRKQLSLSTEKLLQRNKSSHRPYREYYDTALQESVYEFYKKDFAYFDYRPLLGTALNDKI